MEPFIHCGGGVPVNLSIKEVPDTIAAALRERAANNHRSLQRELMAIIEVAASTTEAFAMSDQGASLASHRRRKAGKRLRPIEEIVQEWRRVLPHPTGGPSSTEIIRAMRDTRYGSPASGQPRGRRAR
jgi:plasmid stability protein